MKVTLSDPLVMVEGWTPDLDSVGDYGLKIRKTPEEMRDFLYFMLSRAGANEMITPREIIRSYLTALGILLSDKSKHLPDIYASVVPKEEVKKEDIDPETIEF